MRNMTEFAGHRSTGCNGHSKQAAQRRGKPRIQGLRAGEKRTDLRCRLVKQYPLAKFYGQEVERICSCRANRTQPGADDGGGR